MKIVIISDTHGLHDKIKLPKGDILIHAGDITNIGNEKNIKDFIYWFQNIRGFDQKIFIAGNHEWGFYRKPDWLYNYINEENLSQSDCTYLEDNTFIFESPEFSKPIVFYGSPWTPEFSNWAFNVKRSELYQYWEKIPDNVDILITHGPPHKILDRTVGYDNDGCKTLLHEVITRIKPTIHCFGHIHESRNYQYEKNILFINASICTEEYFPVNDPFVVELKEVNNKLITNIIE